MKAKGRKQQGRRVRQGVGRRVSDAAPLFLSVRTLSVHGLRNRSLLYSQKGMGAPSLTKGL